MRLIFIILACVIFTKITFADNFIQKNLLPPRKKKKNNRKNEEKCRHFMSLKTQKVKYKFFGIF